VADHKAIYWYRSNEHAIGSCNYNSIDETKHERNFLIPGSESTS
jgi:hypothetical protein